MTPPAELYNQRLFFGLSVVKGWAMPLSAAGSLHGPPKTGTLPVVMPRILIGMPQNIGVVCTCLLFGCGPNVQMIYEGNVRFEHCYRLDMDPTIAPPHRRACWQDWLARHTYGQSGDRLSHAQQRLDQMDKGKLGTAPLEIDAGTEGRPAAQGVPMPTDIHAAPPPRAIEPAPVPGTTQSASPHQPPLPPEADCSDECRARWTECGAACGAQENPPAQKGNSEIQAPTSVSVLANQKTQKDACNTCRRTFKACMHRCFK